MSGSWQPPKFTAIGFLHLAALALDVGHFFLSISNSLYTAELTNVLFPLELWMQVAQS